MMLEQRIIGICGLIGSGKSVVMRYYEHQGFPVYDCDSVAKEMYYIPHVRSEIARLVGIDPIDESGELRKVELSRALSLSSELRQGLESIIHVAIFKDIERWRDSLREAQTLFVESAILFTSGLNSLCDIVIAVDAPEEIRRERVLRRDGDKDKERFRRIKTLQQKEAELIEHADVRIINDNKSSVIRQLESINSRIFGRSIEA